MKDVARPDIQPAFAERNVPVALATDENYLPYLKVTINLAIASSPGSNLDIIVLHAGIPEDAIRTFTAGYASVGNASVRFVDISDELETSGLSDYRQTARLPLSACYRLLLPRILPEYDKIAYIDVDVAVCRDLGELYETDVGDNWFAAAKDVVYNTKPEYVSWAGKWGFAEWDGYVNTGVLVMNLERFRREPVFDRLKEIVFEAAKWNCAQDALNFVCKGAIAPLDPRWNVQLGDYCLEKQIALTGGGIWIAHYTGSQKPWKFPARRHSNLWWRHVDERDAARFKAAEMRASILKDYARIARFIHDGERALDFAPLNPSSAAVLSENSLAADVMSVAEFSKDALKDFPDHHFDVIAVSSLAVGGAEPSDLMDALPELQRVLMPAGRLLLIVPNALAAMYAKKICGYLIPEPSVKSAGLPDTTLQVYMRNPLVGRGVPYHETSWVIPDDPAYNMNAFARDYLNPWLVRGIVSGCGHGRLGNSGALAIIRDEILATYPSDSVDYGAALCGKIYAAASDMTNAFLQLVEAYCAIENPKPHQLRWQISNAFALAAHAQKFGNFDIAEQWYAYAAEGDVCTFSPTLGTKVMDAFWQLAQMALDKGDVEKALAFLRRSFARADEILHADWLNVAGDPDCPVPIAYDEIALVCQKAARAAGMVNVLSRHPGRIEQARALARSNAERYAEVLERLKKAQTEIKALKDEIAALKKGRAK